VKQISTRSPGRTPRQSRGMPEGGCDPVGKFLQAKSDHREIRDKAKTIGSDKFVSMSCQWTEVT